MLQEWNRNTDKIRGYLPYRCTLFLFLVFNTVHAHLFLIFHCLCCVCLFTLCSRYPWIIYIMFILNFFQSEFYNSMKNGTIHFHTLSVHVYSVIWSFVNVKPLFIFLSDILYFTKLPGSRKLMKKNWHSEERWKQAKKRKKYTR